MVAIRSLFEGNIRLDAFEADLAVTDGEIALTALTGGTRVSKAIMRNGYRLSPTGSDTIDEPGLEDTGNTGSYGPSNYEVNLPLFRYFDSETGLSDPEQDVAFTLFTGKGVALWLAERVGPPAAEPFKVGDVIDIYPIVLDDPQRPTDLTGYQKVIQPARVSGRVHLRVEVVAGG